MAADNNSPGVEGSYLTPSRHNIELMLKCYKLADEPKYLQQVVELLKGANVKESTRAFAYVALMKAGIDWMKLKADVECWKEQNLKLMGLDSKNPAVEINLHTLSSEKLDELLKQPDQLVESQLVQAATPVPVEVTMDFVEEIGAGSDSAPTGMGVQVAPNLWIGAAKDCEIRDNWSYVHACKTWHSKVLGYTGALPDSHPNYLHYTDKTGNELYLNMIDPDKPLFKMVMWEKALRFIKLKAVKGPLFIHCDQGQSRAPTLALMHLVRTNAIDAKTYDDAKVQFKTLYPGYKPGRGIQEFVKLNWGKLLAV